MASSDFPVSPKPPAADDPTKERRLLEQQCEGLVGKPYNVTSKSSRKYNCVAYANGDIENYWSPREPYVWPDELLRTPFPTVSSFCGYLKNKGFDPCDCREPHPAVERIAIYGDDAGCLHMARQLGGDWLSKMGDGADIEHRELSWIECTFVGRLQAIMCRHYHPELPARPPPPKIITPRSSARSAPRVRGRVVELRFND